MKTTWKEYEIYVFNYLRRTYPTATVYRDVKIKGIISKTMRQIDVFVRVPPNELNITIAIECKFYSKRVDLKTIDSFIGCLDDIKAGKGILISNIGFSQGAIARANNCSRDLELWELGLNSIKIYKNITVVTWGDTVMLMFECPMGWTPLEERTSEITPIFPTGLKLEDAIELNEWVSIVLYSKHDHVRDIASFVKDTIEEGTQEFEILSGISVKNHSGCPSLFQRSIYKGVFYEYNYYVDFKDTIIKYILFTPKGMNHEYLRAFKEIIETSKFIHKNDVTEK